MKNDIRIDRTKLHPYLDYMLGIMLKYCNEEGIFLIITEGYRTVADQDALYAKGRTKPGVKVTNAQGWQYQSQHQWGIAFDIAIKNEGHLWDESYFRKAANIAKKHCKALGWGGDWTILEDGIVDTPHFYIKKWGKNTKKLRDSYKTPDVFAKTWRKQVFGTKKGLPIRKKNKTKVLVERQPNGTVFEVLWQHRFWSKVRYNGKVGYARTKYLREV